MSHGVRPPPTTPKLKFMLIPVLGSTQDFVRTKPYGDRMSVWLHNNIATFFDEGFEHVAVLYNGGRRDMFVGETSSINGRHIRNVRATEIYRAATLARDAALTSRRDPEPLDAISGPAIIFPDEIVWR